MQRSPIMRWEPEGRTSLPPQPWQGQRRLAEPLPAGPMAFRLALVRRLGLFRLKVGSLIRQVQQVPQRPRGEYLELLAALGERVDQLEHDIVVMTHDPRAWEGRRREAEETWRDLQETFVRIAVSFQRRHPNRDRPSRRRV